MQTIVKYLVLYLFLVSTLTTHASEEEHVVFLDHGGHPYHAEVFYSVAGLVLRLYPDKNIVFVINKEFAREVGLDDFWAKYVPVGKLKNLRYRLEDMDWYEPLAGRNKSLLLCHSDEFHPKFWLRVSVTVANLKGVDKCLESYANREGYLFILHHPTPYAGGGGFDGNLIPWKNAYVASNSSTVYKLTERHFSPALMPIPAAEPKCDVKPLFIVQGDLSRRNFIELEWLLSSPFDFNLLYMSRELLRPIQDSRVKVMVNSSMTTFHEAILGAAYMLPLISPDVGKTRSYFHGRSTSSIPYAVHFRLRLISHKAIKRHYEYELGSSTVHYWHDGRKKSFMSALRLAMTAFHTYCESKKDDAGITWAQDLTRMRF